MENKIHLTFPCTQNWEGMQSLGNNKKHCATCNKCVTNFTNLSSNNTQENINAEGGITCGMFRIDQLDNIYQRHTLSRFKSITLTVMGLLGIFATANTAAAQTTEQNLTPVTDNNTAHNLDSIKSPIHVAGRLRDKETLAAAAYVKIEVLQNGTVIKATHTDFEGKFSFVLTKNELTDTIITLRVLYGFPEEEAATGNYTVSNDKSLDAAQFDMLITGIPKHHLVSVEGNEFRRKRKQMPMVLGGAAMVSRVEVYHMGEVVHEVTSPMPLENILLQWNEQR